MRFCKQCHSLMIGEEASQAVRKLEKLLESHRFDPMNSSEIALLMAPVCKRCMQRMDESLGRDIDFDVDQISDFS